MAFNPEEFIGVELTRPFAYTATDVCLYHLGIGAHADQLEWVWEQRLRVLPTFAVIPGFVPIEECVQLPGLEIDLAQLVHQHQSIQVPAPLPAQANGTARTVITGDPNLDLDEVGVPRSIAMNLTYPERGESSSTLFISNI